MPSLKAIRKRIASVKNTQKITKAMKMVSAAKLRRAQDSVIALRPYAGRMKAVVADLVAKAPDELVLSGEGEEEASLHASQGGAQGAGLRGPQVPGQPQGGGDLEGTEGTFAPSQEAGEQPAASWGRLVGSTQPAPAGAEPQRLLVVTVTSDRGLAGAFNSNVARRLERFLVEREGADIRFLTVGKKGREYLARRKLPIIQELAGADPKTAGARAQELRGLLCDMLARGEVDAIYVIYNEFKSASTQLVRAERLLPLRGAESAEGSAKDQGQAKEEGPRLLLDFVYEPDQRQVLMHLVPLQVETELHRIMLESIAAEMAARMSAMDNASRNAKEMVSKLTLQYNRARQAAITKELMEIVGGAEALKG